MQKLNTAQSINKPFERQAKNLAVLRQAKILMDLKVSKPITKNINTDKKIIFKSSNEKVTDYAIYAFAVFCIFLVILSTKQNGRKSYEPFKKQKVPKNNF